MTELDADAISILRRLVGQMVPPAPQHDVPGADDELIFAAIVAELQSQADVLGALLEDLAGAEPAPTGASEFAALRQRHPATFAMIVRVVAQTYYSDDRVMRSLGMEARPPFPKGHEVREGDWSLLDEVRGREPIWRRAE